MCIKQEHDPRSGLSVAKHFRITMSFSPTGQEELRRRGARCRFSLQCLQKTNEVRRLALPLTFSRRAFSGYEARRAPRCLFGSKCLGQAPEVAETAAARLPKPRAFSALRACCPAFSTPRAVCCSLLQAASRALCGPDWRVPSISVDRGLCGLRASAGHLRWSCGQRIGRACRHDMTAQ